MGTNPYIAPQTFPQDFQFVNPDEGTLSVAWYYFLFQFYQRFQTRIITQNATAVASLVVNWAAGANVVLALGTNVTSMVVQNWPPAGQIGFLRFYITSSGSHTISWPSGTKWPGGTPPTLTSGGIDIIQLETDNGGTAIYGTIIGQAYA